MVYHVTGKKHTLILVLAVLALSICPAQAELNDPMSIHVIDAALPDNSDLSTAKPRFSAEEILDLEFVVVLHPTFQTQDDINDPIHTLEFSIFTADGNLYRKIAVPVSFDEPTQGGRRLPGYVRPVMEQQFEEVFNTGGERGFTTSVRFPVAATDIVSRGLYGNWLVSVEGTSEHTTVFADQRFELIP